MHLDFAMRSLAPALAATAGTQRGTFTAVQAMSAGYSMDEIQRLRRCRDLRRWWSIRRGVYVVHKWYAGLSPSEQHGGGLAALSLVLTEPFVFRHETAAVELGLAMLDPDLSRLHVTRGDLDGARTEAGVTNHAAELRPDEVVRGS